MCLHALLLTKSQSKNETNGRSFPSHFPADASVCVRFRPSEFVHSGRPVSRRGADGPNEIPKLGHPAISRPPRFRPNKLSGPSNFSPRPHRLHRLAAAPTRCFH